MVKRYWAAAVNDIETNPCLVEGWVPVHLSSDYDALDAAATALGVEVQRLNMEMAAYRQGCTPADARAMLAVADALQAHKDSTPSGGEKQ